MTLNIIRLYLVTLTRMSTDTTVRVQVEATNIHEASRFAKNTMQPNKEKWIAESVKAIHCPNWIYEEYNGYRFWEEEEILNDKIVLRYHLLPPYTDQCFCPLVSNREELYNLIDSLVEEMVLL